MSHHTVIQVLSPTSHFSMVAMGMAGLIQAVTECGLDVIHEKQLITEDGKSHVVDFVVQEGKTRVGVALDPKTQVASFIAHDVRGNSGKKLAEKIAQRYAYSRVVEELKRKGYQIGKEERAADGTLKIVASRWK